MATPVSNIQILLSVLPPFLARVEYLLCLQAQVVLTEQGVGTTHEMRAAYAKNVIGAPYNFAAIAAPILVSGVNVRNATTYDEQTGVVACTVTDVDLQSQIATFWNALAGIDEGN